MKKTQYAFRNTQVAVVVVFILSLGPGLLLAQVPTNVDWAGGGVFYDRETSRSIRYNERSRKRSQELQGYGSLRYSGNMPAIVSYDDPERSSKFRQQTITKLPEGARELKVSDDLTYYVVDGQYYRKAIEGGAVKYIAVKAP
jgi:hypothetical protein